MELLYEIWELTFEFIKIVLVSGLIVGALVLYGLSEQEDEVLNEVKTIAEKYPLAIQYLQEGEEKQVVEPAIVNPEDTIPDKTKHEVHAEKYEHHGEHKVMPDRGVLTEDSKEELRKKLLAQLDGNSAPADKEHNRAI